MIMAADWEDAVCQPASDEDLQSVLKTI